MRSANIVFILVTCLTGVTPRENRVERVKRWPHSREPEISCGKPYKCINPIAVFAGVTLRENNLKELEGGLILESQGALVANRRALKERDGLLEVVHELIERFEAHLKAGKFYNVLANMRGNSAEEVRNMFC